jgi:gamma-glutamylcyclotransferase (GGCT)/AIG2-like uncharacterized protein YtfP
VISGIQMSATLPLLFVYGTLMRGFHVSWQGEFGAKLVGQGTIRARLYDLGDFPGARLADNTADSSVTGELYRLREPERAIRVLDSYEGYFPTQPYRSLFIRDLVTVTVEGGRRTRAWTYVYNRPVSNAKLIPSGDYRDRAFTNQ